ncbi:MAG: HEAT repeat domain-containing protein [Planctomycetota bacterium]|nr:HEAT repeat domain-containing protein [Planctomycetota bacterium]
MRGFEGELETLGKRFGLSARLRTRIGALRSCGMDLTETVLELARPGTLVEKCLLNASLLEFASTINSETLAEILQGLEQDAEVRALRIIENDGRRVMVHLEEMMAAKDPDFEATFEEGSLIHRPSVEVANPLSSSGNPLLGEEQIDRARLVVLTGMDPKEQIEAIRQIALFPMDLREKGTLLLKALSSRSPGVRAEAASSLSSLGVSAEVSQALRRLAEGEVSRRLFVLRRLYQRFPELEETEQSIVFHVLVGLVESDDPLELRVEVLSGLSDVLSETRSHQALMDSLVRGIVEMLGTHLEESFRFARPVLLALAQREPNWTRSRIWEETQAAVGPLRTYLLSVLAEFESTSAQKKELARVLVAELDREVELDTIFLRLERSLISLGELAVDPLLESFGNCRRPDVLQDQVRLLDEICLSGPVSKKSKQKVLEAVFDRFPRVSIPIQTAILNVRIASDQSLSQRVRCRIAEQLVRDLHRYRDPNLLEDLRGALKRLGTASVKPLLGVLSGSSEEIAQELAAGMLGEVVQGLPGTEEARKLADKSLEYVYEALQTSGAPYKSHLFRSLGQMVCRSETRPEVVQRAATYLLGEVWKSSHVYACLAGLGWTGSAIAAPAKTRVEVSGLLLELIEGRFPMQMSRIRSTDDGNVFEFGPETEAYTVLLPDLMGALARIAICSETPSGLKGQILVRLLSRWQDLIEYRVIWGPANTMLLAQWLSAIMVEATLTSTQRINVFRALMARKDNLHVLEILSRTAVNLDSERKLDEVVAEVVSEALSLSLSKEYERVEDREVLFRILEVISRRSRLDRGVKKTRLLQQRLVSRILDGVKDGVPGARVCLENLVNRDHFTLKLRKEIRSHLDDSLFVPR